MPDLLYQWMDVLWLPIGLVAVRRGQRLMTAAFIIACILTLRTQIELMQSFGYPYGILQWLPFSLYQRGLAVYGALIALFLVLAHLSPRTKGVVFLAVIITLYIFGFCGSLVAMVL